MKDRKSNNCKNKQQRARVYVYTTTYFERTDTRAHVYACLCVCCITHDKIYFYESLFFT